MWRDKRLSNLEARKYVCKNRCQRLADEIMDVNEEINSKISSLRILNSIEDEVIEHSALKVDLRVSIGTVTES